MFVFMLLFFLFLLLPPPPPRRVEERCGENEEAEDDADMVVCFIGTGESASSDTGDLGDRGNANGLDAALDGSRVAEDLEPFRGVCESEGVIIPSSSDDGTKRRVAVGRCRRRRVAPEGEG